MKQLLLIITAGLLIAADDAKKDDAIKDEMKKLEGAWAVETATRDGMEMEEAKGGEAVFSGEKLTLRSKTEGKEMQGTYLIDPAKSPRTIDITMKEGDKGTAHGIYDLKGDTLKICVARPNAERPTEFTEKGTVFITFKRKKS
jgi:uncharacterized protein (TIGR03067 family)